MAKFNINHTRAAKLSPSQVLEIRRLYAEQGWSQGRLSRKFSMSIGQIGRIVRGESWSQYRRTPTEQEITHQMATEDFALPPDALSKLSEALAAQPAQGAGVATGSDEDPSPSPSEDYGRRIAELAEQIRNRKKEQS